MTDNQQDLAPNQDVLDALKKGIEDTKTSIERMESKLAWHIADEQHAHRKAIAANEKIDHHIEIYANNGKEMKKMWETMEQFKNEMLKQYEDEVQRREYDKEGAIEQRELVKKEISSLRLEIQPVIEAFTGLSWSKKALLWIIGLLASIGGLVLTYRQVFKN